MDPSNDFDEEDYTSFSNSPGFSSQRLGLFIFTISGFVALGVVVLLAIRQVVMKNIRWCCLEQRRRRRRRSQQQQQQSSSNSQDEELAAEIQRQLNDEAREAYKIQRRAERTEWYQTYLKPFTMTVQKEDFLYGQEMQDVDNVIPEQVPPDEDDDLEMGNGDASESSSSSHDDDVQLVVVCTETAAGCSHDHDESPHVYLRLPNANGTKSPSPHRLVDGQCAICVCPYEPNDKVVWSATQKCPHAFHYDCILPWLAKGKKRCPICRHWFVPGALIEDQKKALEAMQEASETEEEEDLSTDASSTSSRDLDTSNDGTVVDVSASHESAYS